MLLGKEEIEEVTGYKQRKKQREWFLRQGITCKLGADGNPKVLREHFNAVMGLASKRNFKNSRKPNFEAI